MTKRNYTIIDNFGQEIEDFDIVVSATNNGGNNVNELGFLFGTIVLLVTDYENVDARSTMATIRKNTLWSTGRDIRIINRVEVEVGSLPGRYRMKNVVKINQPTAEMLDFKLKIIMMLENSKVLSNVPRKLINDILTEARLECII